MASASKKVERFVDKAYQNDFMKAVRRQRQNNEYTDVTLQSGDVHIQGHRDVLAIGSEYFKAMQVWTSQKRVGPSPVDNGTRE